MTDTGFLLGDAFAARLPRNVRVQIQSGDCVALYAGTHAIPIYAPIFYTPPDADCYALRALPQAQLFGMANLGTYTLPEYPGEIFRLGLSGEMHISLAHLSGLRPLLMRMSGERSSLRALLDDPFLSRQMRSAVTDAILQTFGLNWDYPRIQAGRTALMQACLQALFPILYANGLLLQPRRFAIRRISPPILAER